MHILVADDGVVAREVLTAMLLAWGHTVVAVTNGDQAMTEIDKNDIDVALLDWMMPGLCGPDLCRAIRVCQKDKYIYIIMVTAKDKKENLIEGLVSGADDYIIKPFDKGELQARLRNGQRLLSLYEKLKTEQERTAQYAQQMEELAQERALQLIHAERMATIGILSAGIAHEINNGITSISLSITAIENMLMKVLAQREKMGDVQTTQSIISFVSDETPRLINDGKEGIQRINSIIKNMKHFSRKDDMNTENCNIEQCVDTALKLSWNKLKYHVKVKKEISPILPLIRANFQEIEQVFVNLFINAADATETVASAELIINAEQKDNNMIIIIADNGPGFSIEQKQKLFEPFYTTKSSEKGTGLGLSICRGIIEKYRGDISAENRLEGGAKVIIRIPC